MNIAVAPRQKESYDALLLRLSELSVRKYSDPYTDIAWDAPENAIDPNDPRFAIDPEHALAHSAWYARLDATTRARFGLEWSTQILKYGIHFEAVLDRGLLEFCDAQPNRSRQYRYAMHEVIEEGRHSLMFQEFIDRSGCDPRPLGWLQLRIDDRVAHWGQTFPALFFFAVLAGELFIDDFNRNVLRRPVDTVHPLVRKIMQIHVTEEARHVCFAENYLREHLPKASAYDRMRMAWAVPVIFSDAARLMLVPDARIAKQFGIDKHTLDAAFKKNPEHRVHLARITQSVRELLEPFGMLRPHHKAWWRFQGLL
jgi:hypothetical protein